MASSTKNVKLGVCKVYYDGADLGLTQGGVEVSVSTQTFTVEVDQFGKTAINELVQGREVKVKCPLAETTVRNLAATMPGTTLVTDGVQASGTITYTINPGATNTITIGGQAFTYQVAKPTTAFQIMIGANLAETLKNTADVINRALLQPLLGNLSASVNALNTIVTIKANDPGVAGNAVTLAVGGTAPPAVSGGTLAGGVNETRVRAETSTGVGLDLLTTAKLLRLHPTSKADNDFSDDLVVYQAGSGGAISFAYKVDQVRVYNIEFTGYPDVSGKLFAVGDLLA